MTRFPRSRGPMRRIALGLLLLNGCYFTTPTHPADPEDDTMEPSVVDGGTDDDAPVGVELDADAPAVTDGGTALFDALPLSDALIPFDAPFATSDAMVDTGPTCSCTPARPVCLAASATCVQCAQESDCSGGTHCQTSPTSSLVNTCVQCRQESDCSGGTHCLVSTGQCVACLNASHCASRAAASACDTTTYQCRPCTSDNECASVPGLNVCQAGTCVQCAGAKRTACGEDRPACNATTFSCETCKADSDCSRFNKVCDEASARCVACTVDTEAARCGNRSCNPATFACTQTPRGSVEACSPCVADSECMTDHRCIALNFRGEALGGYCLRREPTGSGCAQPYPIRITRASLSRAPSANYCGFSEERTSCDAIRALLTNKGCPGGATECEAEGAVCGTVGTFIQRCSYTCTGSAECPAFAPCPTSGTNLYCGKSM